MSDPREEIRNFEIPNPLRPRAVTDFECCPNIGWLTRVLQDIDRRGYVFLCATQNGGTYTVFFRRPAP